MRSKPRWIKFFRFIVWDNRKTKKRYSEQMSAFFFINLDQPCSILFKKFCKTSWCFSFNSGLVITPFLTEKFSLKLGKENLCSTRAPNRGSNFSVTPMEPVAPLPPLDAPKTKTYLSPRNLRSTLDNQSIRFLKYAEGFPLC